MRRFFLRFGEILFFSRKHKSVRGGVLFLLTNLLLLASIIFVVEIILIFLAIGDFYIPLTNTISEFLAKLVFR